jgi:hypothetical protein
MGFILSVKCLDRFKRKYIIVQSILWVRDDFVIKSVNPVSTAYMYVYICEFAGIHKWNWKWWFYAATGNTGESLSARQRGCCVASVAGI